LVWRPEIHMFFFSLVNSRKEIELRVSDRILVNSHGQMAFLSR
jgi:hypothetical protein